MGSIAVVILPCVGRVCPECFSRGHVAAMPLKVPELYSFGFTNPVSELDWDIDAARAMVAARGRRPVVLDTTGSHVGWWNARVSLPSTSTTFPLNGWRSPACWSSLSTAHLAGRPHPSES
jgi:hypothetical protein